MASSIASDLFAEYGDLPPEAASERIYGSTPYPPDKMILFHNESSHLASWPLRQFFFCVTPAPDRGETPLLDCRDGLEALDPELREQFDGEGAHVRAQLLRGHRRAVAGLLPHRRQGRGREDLRRRRHELRVDRAAACASARSRRAVTTHPRTGEQLFFNQVQLHHVSCLDDETRTALRQLFADEDLPRNVYFGDGTPIPDEVIDRIGELYEELCVEFPWQKGDLIAVDNMLVAHARRPFSGPRKLLVAMGEMIEAGDTAGGGLSV